MKLINYFLLLIADGVRNVFEHLRRVENLLGKSETTSQYSCELSGVCVDKAVHRLPRHTHFWQQEVQQSPELMQVVLQRSACNEQTALGVVEPNDLRQY